MFKARRRVRVGVVSVCSQCWETAKLSLSGDKSAARLGPLIDMFLQRSQRLCSFTGMFDLL